jgi:hypothetical protein
MQTLFIIVLALVAIDAVLSIAAKIERARENKKMAKCLHGVVKTLITEIESQEKEVPKVEKKPRTRKAPAKVE